jgi:phage terminase small subunit
MSRPRKPTQILELTGHFKHDPKRAIARINEPRPSKAIGTPPAYFDDLQISIWDEMVRELPKGVAMNSDAIALESLVLITCKIRLLGVNASTSDFAQQKAFLCQFGMTPAARSLVQIKQEDQANEFSDI